MTLSMPFGVLECLCDVSSRPFLNVLECPRQASMKVSAIVSSGLVLHYRVCSLARVNNFRIAREEAVLSGKLVKRVSQVARIGSA